MSIMSLDHTMQRIESAEVDSRIAVFKSDEVKGVNTIFAATLKSMDMIRVDPDLIGVFDKTMDQNLIREIIKPHIKPKLSIAA